LRKVKQSNIKLLLLVRHVEHRHAAPALVAQIDGYLRQKAEWMLHRHLIVQLVNLRYADTLKQHWK
jgi:hypothetical protein